MLTIYICKPNKDQRIPSVRRLKSQGFRVSGAVQDPEKKGDPDDTEPPCEKAKTE